jgi:hypothetical protein
MAVKVCMISIRAYRAKTLSWAVALLLLQLGLFSMPGFAAEEMTSAFRRYGDSEVSTGYYEEYEAAPRRQQPFISVPGVREGLLPYSPKPNPQVQVRTRLYDSHLGVKFYERLRCAYCHPEQTKGMHVARANLTCRQCHGGEPIAGLQYIYSPMNPIRRHAYVCAKCHEGASVSFAAYVVHEPPPGSEAARKEFPALHYAYWFMVVLLIGTMAFAVPHAFLIGLRELVSKLRHKHGGKHHAH